MKKLIGIIIAGSIAALLGLCIYHRCFSMIPPVDMATQLDNYITSWVKQNKFSGSVLVAQKGKILLCKGYGMANYEHMVPNTPETKFHIASIAKQFTSMAIMQLVQSGKLKLTDAMASILPDVPHGKEITVYQLLTMSSGLHNLGGFTGSEFDITKPVTLADMFAYFKDKPLTFAPGSKYEYNNENYAFLAAIIEKLSGNSYETFLQEHIFKPLDMKNSGVVHNKPILAHRAQGYSLVDTGLENAQYYDPSIMIGSGGIYSTIEDMYLWDRALYADKILKSELREQLWQPYLENYCLGWQRGTILGHDYVWHGGDTCDCTARILRFINDDICIIILSNVGFAHSVNSIVSNIAAIIFGKKPLIAITLDPSLYAAYVGQYELAPTQFFTVTTDKEKLFIQPTGQKALEVLPESETEFFNDFDDIYMRMSFTKNVAGNVIELILYGDDEQKIVAKKIT